MSGHGPRGAAEYDATMEEITPRLEALRLEGIVARRSMHGSTTGLQSCLKNPLVRCICPAFCISHHCQPFSYNLHSRPIFNMVYVAKLSKRFHGKFPWGRDPLPSYRIFKVFLAGGISLLTVGMRVCKLYTKSHLFRRVQMWSKLSFFHELWEPLLSVFFPSELLSLFTL